MSKTHRDWQFHVESRAGNEVEISVYDVIGGGIFGGGVTAKDVLSALRKNPSAQRITLRINSVGGIVDDARAMINLLNERRSAGVTVEAHIDGLAASAAAYLTTAADRVVMPDNAFIMIHEARGRVFGTASNMESAADLMRKTNDQMATAFAESSARRGKGKGASDFLAEFRKGDKYLDAKESVEWGLADEVTEPLQAVACLADVSDLSGAPSELVAAPYATLSRTQDEAHPVATVGDAVSTPAPPQDQPAPAVSGGAQEPPQRSTKMDENQFKNEHSALYAQLREKFRAEGAEAAVTNERDRIESHLHAGEESGDMKTAIEAIRAGDQMSQKHISRYLMAGMKKNAVTARQEDSDGAGVALAGADEPSEPVAEDFGDKVWNALQAQGGL